MFGVAQLDPTGRVRFIPARIPNGQSLSDPVDLLNHEIKGLIIPAAFTGGSVSFQATQPQAPAGDNWLNVFDSGGAEVALNVVAGRYMVLQNTDHERMSALSRIKLRAGTSGAPQNQTGDQYVIIVACVSYE